MRWVILWVGVRRRKAAKAIAKLTPFSRPLAGTRVEVCEFPDGALEIRYEGTVLSYHMLDKIRQVNQATIVENKHLDTALDDGPHDAGAVACAEA